MADRYSRERRLRLSQTVVKACQKMLVCRDLTPDQRKQVEEILETNEEKVLTLEAMIALEAL